MILYALDHSKLIETSKNLVRALKSKVTVSQLKEILGTQAFEKSLFCKSFTERLDEIDGLFHPEEARCYPAVSHFQECLIFEKDHLEIDSRICDYLHNDKPFALFEIRAPRETLDTLNALFINPSNQYYPYPLGLNEGANEAYITPQELGSLRESLKHNWHKNLGLPTPWKREIAHVLKFIEKISLSDSVYSVSFGT